MADPIEDSNKGSNKTDISDAEEGRAKLSKRYSTFNAYFSAMGSSITADSPAVAFNMAQPTYMIIGFMVTAVVMGILLLTGLPEDWYNLYGYRVLIFSLPLFAFMVSWMLQYSNNRGKDGDFKELIDNYCRAINATQINRN